MKYILTNKPTCCFLVPSRSKGVPIQYQGIYWMRRGEELVSMTQDMLKRIFEESVPDFSAQVCPHATLEDLDCEAIKRFREMWHRKSGNGALKKISDEQLLRDCEAIVGKGHHIRGADSFWNLAKLLGNILRRRS